MGLGGHKTLAVALIFFKIYKYNKIGNIKEI
jgi:hypothetical protein